MAHLQEELVVHLHPHQHNPTVVVVKARHRLLLRAVLLPPAVVEVLWSL